MGRQQGRQISGMLRMWHPSRVKMASGIRKPFPTAGRPFVDMKCEKAVMW